MNALCSCGLRKSPRISFVRPGPQAVSWPSDGVVQAHATRTCSARVPHHCVLRDPLCALCVPTAPRVAHPRCSTHIGPILSLRKPGFQSGSPAGGPPASGGCGAQDSATTVPCTKAPVLNPTSPDRYVDGLATQPDTPDQPTALVPSASTTHRLAPLHALLRPKAVSV